jgi:hypothetical protein
MDKYFSNFKTKDTKIDYLSQLNTESKVLGNSFPRPTRTDIKLRLTMETILLFLSVKEHVYFCPPVIICEPVKSFLLKLLSSARTRWLYTKEMKGRSFWDIANAQYRLWNVRNDL